MGTTVILMSIALGEYGNMLLTSVISACGLAISTITFIIKFFTSIRDKKFLSQMLLVSEAIIPLVEEAERFVNFSGIEKKEFVMTRVIELMNSNHWKISKETVSDKIESFVSLSKKVNAFTKKNVKELDALRKETIYGRQ